MFAFVYICSAHAGHIGSDRSLLTGHDAPLVQQIVRDLLHALSHRHDYTRTAFVEPIIGADGNKLITFWSPVAFYLSEKKRIVPYSNLDGLNNR